MPRRPAWTSTFALNNVTLPFVQALADKGPERALIADGHLRNGLNVYRGQVTQADVARDLGYPYVPPEEALRREPDGKSTIIEPSMVADQSPQ